MPFALPKHWEADEDVWWEAERHGIAQPWQLQGNKSNTAR